MENVNVNETIVFLKKFLDKSGIKYVITINEKNEIVVNVR